MSLVATLKLSQWPPQYRPDEILSDHEMNMKIMSIISLLFSSSFVEFISWKEHKFLYIILLCQ